MAIGSAIRSLVLGALPAPRHTQCLPRAHALEVWLVSSVPMQSRVLRVARRRRGSGASGKEVAVGVATEKKAQVSFFVQSSVQKRRAEETSPRPPSHIPFLSVGPNKTRQQTSQRNTLQAGLSAVTSTLLISYRYFVDSGETAFLLCLE